jgi:hypothetical protein
MVGKAIFMKVIVNGDIQCCKPLSFTVICISVSQELWMTNIQHWLSIWLWVYNTIVLCHCKRVHLMLYVGKINWICDDITELKNTEILTNHSTKRQINHGGYQVIIRHLSSSLCLVPLGQSRQTPTAWREELVTPTVWATVINIAKKVSLLFCTSSDYYYLVALVVMGGAWGSTVVKALCYKLEGPGIDSQCRWEFFPWHLIVPRALGSTQPLKMSTRIIMSVKAADA